MGSRLDAAGADPGDHDDDQPDRNRPYRGEDVEKGLGSRVVHSQSSSDPEKCPELLESERLPTGKYRVSP